MSLAALAGLAVGGWLLAIGATVGLALLVRLSLARRESAVRVAHELRGPLTAIGLACQLEARRPEGGASPRWRAVELELGRAALALEDLCAQRAWRSARLPARVERLAARGLLERAVCAAGPRAAAAGVTLELGWSGPDGFVWGDDLRLAQALGNLIANAIEHGCGPAEVRGRLSGAGLRIEVRDHGPGLPAPVAELARRARGGVGQRGRGLAIAGEIAREHRGRLAAAPCERGARVVLEIPAAAGH